MNVYRDGWRFLFFLFLNFYWHFAYFPQILLKIPLPYWGFAVLGGVTMGLALPLAYFWHQFLEGVEEGFEKREGSFLLD